MRSRGDFFLAGTLFFLVAFVRHTKFLNHGTTEFLFWGFIYEFTQISRILLQRTTARLSFFIFFLPAINRETLRKSFIHKELTRKGYRKRSK